MQCAAHVDGDAGNTIVESIGQAHGEYYSDWRELWLEKAGSRFP